MRRYAVFATLFLIAAVPRGLTRTDGAAVSPEIFPGPFDLADMPNMDDWVPEDFNLTDFEKVMREEHPHSNLNVMEVIALYDYVGESHQVETADGHILEMHRIAGNKTSRSPDGKPVVFLMHGLLCSSMDWVIAGPDRGLAFILADAGYDVWMGNARGNKYSRLHKTLTVNDPDYWGFSWHEIGTIDVPAMIDYALAQRGQKKLFYVGHSQGSTTFFVMMTERPEYNDKVQAMFSLAPVAYCSKMFSPVMQFLARIIKPINLVTKFIGQYEFKPSSMFFNKFKSLLCTNSEIAEKFCRNSVFMVTGFNKEQFDMSLLPAILSHIPAGSAVDQFVHYAQIIKSGNFRKFDHGMFKNLKKYGSLKPPNYDFKNVKVPVALHYSVNDWLSNTNDVEKLYSQLPNPIGKFRVPDDKFNHIDYLWAKDVKDLLYDKIINLMERYKD